MEITAKAIQDAIDKADKILRPYYIYVNPDETQDTKDKLSKHGKIIETKTVEIGKVVVVKREEIDKWRT